MEMWPPSIFWLASAVFRQSSDFGKSLPSSPNNLLSQPWVQPCPEATAGLRESTKTEWRFDQLSLIGKMILGWFGTVYLHFPTGSPILDQQRNHISWFESLKIHLRCPGCCVSQTGTWRVICHLILWPPNFHTQNRQIPLSSSSFFCKI